MDEEHSLLATIRASTHDDAPRLVYADWLLERGDTARGEYITLACADARGELSKEGREELRLLKANEDRWLGTIPSVTTTPRLWSRGLPEHVKLLQEGSPQELEASVGDPAWRMVQRLDALGRLFVVEAARLVGHPVLGDLHGLAIGVDVLNRLLEAETLPKTRTLEIARGSGRGGGPIGRGGSNKLNLSVLFAPLVSTLNPSSSDFRLRKLLFNLPTTPEQVALLSHPQVTVGVMCEPKELGHWQRALENSNARFAKVVFAGRHGFSRLINFEQLQITLRPVPEDDNRYSHIEIRWEESDDHDGREGVIIALQAMPPDAFTYVLADGPINSDDVRGWLARLKEIVQQQQRASFGGRLAQAQS